MKRRKVLISPRLTTWKVRLTSYLVNLFPVALRITLFTRKFDIEIFRAYSASLQQQKHVFCSSPLRHHKLFIKSNFLESFWSLIDIFIIRLSFLRLLLARVMSRRIHHGWKMCASPRTVFTCYRKMKNRFSILLLVPSDIESISSSRETPLETLSKLSSANILEAFFLSST